MFLTFTSLYSYVFYLLGAIIQMSALIVVSALNAIHRVALLIVVFMCGAFIFQILDYYFLGLTYIIVYVGDLQRLLYLSLAILPFSLPQDPWRGPYLKHGGKIELVLIIQIFSLLFTAVYQGIVMHLVQVIEILILDFNKR